MCGGSTTVTGVHPVTGRLQDPVDVDPVTLAAKVSAVRVEKHFLDRGKTGVHALGPIDLSIEEGQFVCIVGPSGCGKSTLLRIVAGLITPTSGSVELRVSRIKPSPTAMVFQDYGIYPWKTVEDNIRFGLDIAGTGREEANSVVESWLDRLDLAAFAQSYPNVLSGGMRQRVAIARALAVEPEILLMDEPFAALDAQLRQVLQEELLQIWERDRRTVIFVTHSLEEAIVLGDRIVVMSARPGRVVLDEPVPFSRPRSTELRASNSFNAFRTRLWDCLRGEVEATSGSNSGPDLQQVHP